jgi:cytochrome P450/NADPH-cytochrome P450 reductase
LIAVAKTASSVKDVRELGRLSTDAVFKSEVLEKKASVLDILKDLPSTQLPFPAYLDMLKPLSPRQYSISSAPVVGEAAATGNIHEELYTASITFDKVEAPARSGNGRVFHGLACNYLASRPVGDSVRCFVRPTNAAFQLPPDLETPVIMVSAGTVIAPMRGFIEERVEMAAAGRKLGKALLYFGCRHHEKDFIYKEQLKEWEKLGAFELRPAFSQIGPHGESSHKYVHARLWAERDELSTFFEDGVKILVCGSAAKFAKSSADVCQQIYQEKNQEKSSEDAFEWLQKQREDRYVSGVFD